MALRLPTLPGKKPSNIASSSLPSSSPSRSMAGRLHGERQVVREVAREVIRLPMGYLGLVSSLLEMRSTCCRSNVVSVMRFLYHAVPLSLQMGTGNSLLKFELLSKQNGSSSGFLTGVLGVCRYCPQFEDGYIFGVLGASPSCQILFLDLVVFVDIRWLVICNF